MIRCFTIPFTFFIVSNIAYSQSSDIGVNIGVDTANTEIKQVVELWNNYLTLEDSVGLAKSIYWNEEEQNEFNNFDLLSLEFGKNWYRHYQKKIIAVKHIAASTFEIKTLFYNQDSASVTPIAIINIYARKINNNYKLENAWKYNTKNWQRVVTEHIAYYFPGNHSFNKELALEMNAFIDSLCIQIQY